MTSTVTEAMIESYALMCFVMVTFFVYFCVMVWAFSNPKEDLDTTRTHPGDVTLEMSHESSLEQIMHSLQNEKVQRPTGWRGSQENLEIMISAGEPVRFHFDYSPVVCTLKEISA